MTDWLIFPGHAAFITTAVANRAFLEELPESLRSAVVTSLEELEPWIFAEQTGLESQCLAEILRDKRRQRQAVHLVGDPVGLLGSLSPDDRRELVDANPYLQAEPPLSVDEVATLRAASLPIRDIFLEIGGPGAKSVLERVIALGDAAD